MLIDSHCHLVYDGLAERQGEVLAAARARGIGGFLNISTRQSEWNDVIAVADREPDVWASVGVHPHEADAHPDLGATALVDASVHPKVVAIGECGLDYYYDKSDRAAQRERFAAHIDAARQTGLPLIIHTRDAEADTAEMLTEAVGQGGIAAVLHCFTGSADLARTALDLGLFISISGIVTFKNAKDLQDAAEPSPPTACWLKPIPRSSPPSRIAVKPASLRSSPTPPPSLPNCVARRSNNCPLQPPPTSSDCLRRLVPRGAKGAFNESPHPRLRNFIGRAADR